MNFLILLFQTAFCGFLPPYEELALQQTRQEINQQPVKLIVKPMVATGKRITFHQSIEQTTVEVERIDFACDLISSLGRQSFAPIFKTESGGSSIQDLALMAQFKGSEKPSNLNSTISIATKEYLYQIYGNGQSVGGFRFPVPPLEFDVYGTFENVTFIGTRACKLYRLTQNRVYPLLNFKQDEVSEGFFAFDVFTDELVMIYSHYVGASQTHVFMQLFENIQTVSKEEIVEKYAKVPKVLEDLVFKIEF